MKTETAHLQPFELHRGRASENPVNGYSYPREEPLTLRASTMGSPSLTEQLTPLETCFQIS
jgi:hypothetical protein